VGEPIRQTDTGTKQEYPCHQSPAVNPYKLYKQKDCNLQC